jgi:hypothetical protein
MWNIEEREDLQNFYTQPDEEVTSPWLWLDRVILAILSLYGVVILGSLLLAPQHFRFAEDAIILHQYSRNLADHAAITYYAGGPHTEGATDFGWMLFLAAAIRVGISPVMATGLVNIASLILLAFTLLRIAQVKPNLWRVLALIGAAGLFPQILASFAGFAVLPEALLLVLLVEAVLKQKTILAPVLALLVCLFRPDGVLFSVPLLFSLFIGSRQKARQGTYLACLFFLPGVLYFVWRWWYFQELFPLPFLVKSDTHRLLGVLVPHSFSQSLKYLLFDAAILFPLRRICLRPALIVSLFLIPTVFYWGMRLDQNVGDRFFYYLPLAAAVTISVCWPSIQLNEKSLLVRVGVGAFLVFMLGPLKREVRSFRDFQFGTVQALAKELGQMPTRGTMLTSEAGYLAYESGWVVNDSWGLDTAQFAKRFFQPSDVSRLNPDLIALHPDIPGDCLRHREWPNAYAVRTWENMIRNVVMGADSAHTYDLWYLPYGSSYYQNRKHWTAGEGDQECFFVNRGSPRHGAINTLLQNHHAVFVAHD